MRSGRYALCALLVIALLPLFPVSAFADSGATYTVRAGDTLRSIAATFGTAPDVIARANGITDPDLIRPGQKLVIPAAGTGDAGRPASSTTPKKAARYTVQPGDTLQGIAQRFDSSVKAIVQTNNLPDPDRLAVGAVLVIPGSAGSATASRAPSSKGAPAADPAAYHRYGGGPPTTLQPTRFAASISKQHCWLIQNNDLTGSWPCSTGRKGYETPPGWYTVQTKLPVAYGSRWDFNMPYWLGLYSINGVENGIHGLPYNRWGFKDWAKKIGRPISFGCIVLQDAAAKQVYQAARLGMQVIILK